MTFFINEIAKLVGFYSLAFILGTLVSNHNIKVNYTRKIHHFSLLFFPIFLASYFPPQANKILGLLSAFGFIWTLVPFYFRKNIFFLERCFLSFDRPEDRPFTLIWILTQFFASILGRYRLDSCLFSNDRRWVG